MKLTKSGVLAISGMLIANSLLLMATTYAATVNPTDKGKYISTDPSHAEQKIESINFIENAQEKACSLVIFDTSGSMGYDLEKPECATPGEKRANAVKGAIEYSKEFLKQNDKNEVGLILFGDGAYYEETHYIINETYCPAYGGSTRGQKLSRNSLDINKFGRPGEWTRLDLGLKKAYDVFNGSENKDRCKQKIVVIISDGAPNGDRINENEIIENVYKRTNKLREEGVTIYTIGYGLGGTDTNVKGYGDLENGAEVLGNIGEGLFYKADYNDIGNIFKKVAARERSTSDNNIKTENYKLKINSENLILKTKTGNNMIVGNSKHSSILGGEHNYISISDDSTIIAGAKNIIQFSKNSSILGGSGNLIEGKNTDSEGKNTNDEYKSSENNIIMGGYNNNIKNGINSSIPGGTGNTINGGYSTIVGNNSIITGNYSVAMGHGTKLSGDNSFYRTDPAHNKTPLNHSNVFAVLSNSGMVVNTDTAHPKAQLTISGTLIVRENTNDENVVCGNSKGKGILKAVKKNNGETCFCTCDGDKWKSMYNGSCEAKCNPEILPSCGEKLTLECKENKYVFSGSCNLGKVIDNSYYISTGNKIHWTCQTYDGQTLNCSGSTPINNALNCNPEPQHNNPDIPPEPNPPQPGLPGKCTGLPANANPNNNETPASNTKYTYSTDKGKLCTFQCDNGYEYINGECKLKQGNSECKLKFQIEVDGKIVGYNEVHNYVNEIDYRIFKVAYYSCNTCDLNKMNICSDCINYPEGNRKNDSVNHILSNIKAVGHPGISVKDGYEYVDWYRDGSPLNIDIQGIEEEHLTCNSTFTLKIKSKTKGAGKCTGLPANAKPNNYETPASDTKYTYNTDVLTVCSFQCNNGYQYDSSTNTCKEKTGAGKCTGGIPGGAILVQGSATGGLSENTGYKLYESVENAGSNPCACVCDSEHVYMQDPNGHRCLQIGKCVGDTRDNAELVNGSYSAGEWPNELYNKTKEEVKNMHVPCAYVCDSKHEYYEDPTTGKKSCIEKGKGDDNNKLQDRGCNYDSGTCINSTLVPVKADEHTKVWACVNNGKNKNCKLEWTCGTCEINKTSQGKCSSMYYNYKKYNKDKCEAAGAWGITSPFSIEGACKIYPVDRRKTDEIDPEYHDKPTCSAFVSQYSNNNWYVSCFQWNSTRTCTVGEGDEAKNYTGNNASIKCKAISNLSCK